METNSPSYGIVSGQSRPHFLRSPEKRLGYILREGATRRGVKCRDLQPSFASSSSHSSLPLFDILQLLLPSLCIGCGFLGVSLPELNQIPIPELISNPISHTSGIDVGIPQCCYRHS